MVKVTHKCGEHEIIYEADTPQELREITNIHFEEVSELNDHKNGRRPTCIRIGVRVPLIDSALYPKLNITGPGILTWKPEP